MSIKAKDNELIYLGCLICKQIEDLQATLKENNANMIEKKMDNLVSLKDKWADIAIKSKGKN